VKNFHDGEKYFKINATKKKLMKLLRIMQWLACYRL
jgi:hypothetical protein